ncbi:glycosyltransferase family 39 protein [Patescibacteria group bacterium]
MKKNLLPIVAALVFFIVSFLTLKDYFISWDEPIHFERGQAYLHYFLTGSLDYSDISKQDLQGTMGDPKRVEKPRRSLYQSDLHNGKYFLENDSGHPPLNGILAAFSNHIFYEKLGILDDISSYHLFNILCSSLLVYVVVAFSLEFFGYFPAIFSFFAISTYPLFFAESHFNIKDPVETAFFSATFLFFWKFWKFKKDIYLVPAFIFFTLALGTKFNALFILVIFLIFLLLRYGKQAFKKNEFYSFLSSKYKYIFIGVCASFALFILSWPYLSNNFPNNLLQIFTYYKEIGTGFNYQPSSLYFFGFNTFPLQWILFTTPPLIALFTFIGLLYSFRKSKKYSHFPLFLIIWFLVPVLRVSMPGTTIYGGIRQIMEFLPAMIIIASFGFGEVIKMFKSWKLEKIKYLIFVLFFFPIFSNVTLHPNQNLYFNFLIGGLSGAYEKNFPSWGNSFGNIYQHGLKWINEYLPLNSKFTLLQNASSNIPIILIRSDIDYRNENWSGVFREGEYLMEMIFNDTAKTEKYYWKYTDNFLIPVYEYKLDGISLLKIWKNDKSNSEYFNEVPYYGFGKTVINSNILTIDLKSQVELSRIKIQFDFNDQCYPVTNTYVESSLDEKVWDREKDWIPSFQVKHDYNLKDSTVEYFLAGKKARYVRLWLDNQKSCLLNKPSFSFYIMKE